jgi:hypothetical protein
MKKTPLVEFYSELLHFLLYTKGASTKEMKRIMDLAKKAKPNIPGRFTAATIRALKKGELHPRFDRYKALWERLQVGVRVDADPQNDRSLRTSFGLLETGTFLPRVWAA